MRLVLQKQDEERAVKATQIFNTWRDGLNTFSAGYVQKKQGELAKDAGAEFRAFARQSGSQTLDGIRDGKLRNMLMHSMAGAEMHFTETGLHYGKRQMEAYKQSELEGDRERLLRTVGENAYNQDWVTHQEADHVTRVREAHPGMDTGAYEGDLRRRIFTERLYAMSVNKDYGNMDALARRGETEGALRPADVLYWQHAADAGRSRQLALHEGEVKKQREASEKDLYTLSLDGKLTREAVEAQRDILSPEGYHKFLKLTRGESRFPDKSDPEALILLQRKAVNGDADFRDTADELLRAGRLTPSDYTRRGNEVQQWRNPAMKEADSILRAKTGHSDFTPNPDAANSYVMAHRDFMDWLDSDEGKKADDNARIKMAERIGDLYRLNAKQSAISVPAPRNLVGTRTQPDIPGTLRKIEAERAAGRLTEERYRQEMIRIKRLADIFQAEAERKQQDAAGRSAR
jgi:hypothetical protein